MSHAHHPAVRQLLSAMRGPCAVSPGASILVAVSGGADSVAMLRACELLAPRRLIQWQLHIAHIHHGQRGSEADEDSQFVQSLAQQHGLPFHLHRLDPKTLQGNLEQAMRHARYQALSEIATEHRCSHVVTAHSADDQLETMLMRLVREATPQSMCGIAFSRPLDNSAKSPALIRPWLRTTRAQIRDFLQQIKQPWREDATNQNTQYTRALLRQKVLPALEQLTSQPALRAQQLSESMFATILTSLDTVPSDIPIDQPLERQVARRMSRDLRITHIQAMAQHYLQRPLPATSAAHIADQLCDSETRTRHFDLGSNYRGILCESQFSIQHQPDENG